MNMEHLSSSQLQKYEDILQKIEEEHRKRDELKKQIEILDDKIIATSLTSKKDLAKHKIFRVLVKVYDSVFDVHDQLSDRIPRLEIEKLFTYAGNKYYLIEVFVSKTFQERVIQKNWLVSASVENKKCHVNKSVNLNRKAMNPICLIVPFENTVEDALVEVYISWPGVEGVWPCLKIASIPIDISYHLRLYSDLRIKDSFYFKIINLSKLYGSKSLSWKMPIVKCKVACQTDFEQFLKVLIKNSYHNWDPRRESCFSKTEYTAVAKTASGFGNSIGIELDTTSNSLTIHGNPVELSCLKRYFLTEFSQETYEIRKDIDKCIKALKESFQGNVENFSALVNIYQELNNLNI